MPTVSDVIVKLNENYQPDEHIAVAIWCEDDVIGRARERHKVVSREQAQRILDTIDNKQDCSLGISWDTLDFYIDDELERSQSPCP